MALFKELSVVLAVQSSWDEASSDLPCTAKLSVAEWMGITEREVMHNADNLLACDRRLASTIVTAERISDPRKTAADNA
jgi:hypothetical protein